MPSTQLIDDSRDASEDPDKDLYEMHPSCWEILLQQYAHVAPPNKTSLDLEDFVKIFLQIPLGQTGGGFRPDWATDYAGPEQFWWMGQDIDFEQVPEWRFLAHHPGTANGFDELLANPPLESAANISPQIQFVDDGGDIFSRLPAELLEEILVLLPSTSVRDLQFASRKVASVHLSSRYWRSRFNFPNELSHVRLPPALLQSGREQLIDWRHLCDQLLHPVGDEYKWWQNRKRITALNKRLVKSMAHRRSDGRLKLVEDLPILQ